MSSLLHYFIFSAKLAVLPAIWIDSIYAWIYPWELPRWLRGKESSGNAEAAGGTGWIPEWGRSCGDGNGNPLQYSCLENPTDRGAWQAPVSRVTESQTRLSSWAQPLGNFSSRWTRMGTQLSVVPSQTPGSKLPIYVHLSWFWDFTCLLEELNTLDLGHEFFLKVRLKISGLILILSLFLPVMTNGDHQDLKSLWCSQVCFKGLFPRWNLVALPSQWQAFIWPRIWI